jgi:hypothetical protein
MYKYISTTLNNYSNDVINSKTDLDGLRGLRALKTSDSEIRAKDEHSEDYESVGKTSGQRLLYTD